jgi:hypothetical protein
LHNGAFTTVNPTAQSVCNLSFTVHSDLFLAPRDPKAPRPRLPFSNRNLPRPGSPEDCIRI